MESKIFSWGRGVDRPLGYSFADRLSLCDISRSRDERGVVPWPGGERVSALAVSTDGCVYVIREEDDDPRLVRVSRLPLPGGHLACKVSVGGTHFAVLTRDGTCFVWGRNSRGQCGGGGGGGWGGLGDIGNGSADDASFTDVGSRGGGGGGEAGKGRERDDGATTTVTANGEPKGSGGTGAADGDAPASLENDTDALGNDKGADRANGDGDGATGDGASPSRATVPIDPSDVPLEPMPVTLQPLVVRSRSGSLARGSPGFDPLAFREDPDAQAAGRVALRFADVALGWDHTLLVSGNGKLYAMGGHDSKPLHEVPACRGLPVIAVRSGSDHCAALTSLGDIVAFTLGSGVPPIGGAPSTVFHAPPSCSVVNPQFTVGTSLRPLVLRADDLGSPMGLPAVSRDAVWSVTADGRVVRCGAGSRTVYAPSDAVASVVAANALPNGVIPGEGRPFVTVFDPVIGVVCGPDHALAVLTVSCRETGRVVAQCCVSMGRGDGGALGTGDSLDKGVFVPVAGTAWHDLDGLALTPIGDGVQGPLKRSVVDAGTQWIHRLFAGPSVSGAITGPVVKDWPSMGPVFYHPLAALVGVSGGSDDQSQKKISPHEYTAKMSLFSHPAPIFFPLAAFPAGSGGNGSDPNPPPGDCNYNGLESFRLARWANSINTVRVTHTWSTPSSLCGSLLPGGAFDPRAARENALSVFGEKWHFHGLDPIAVNSLYGSLLVGGGCAKEMAESVRLCIEAMDKWPAAEATTVDDGAVRTLPLLLMCPLMGSSTMRNTYVTLARAIDGAHFGPRQRGVLARTLASPVPLAGESTATGAINIHLFPPHIFRSRFLAPYRDHVTALLSVGDRPPYALGGSSAVVPILTGIGAVLHAAFQRASRHCRQVFASATEPIALDSDFVIEQLRGLIDPAQDWIASSRFNGFGNNGDTGNRSKTVSLIESVHFAVPAAVKLEAIEFANAVMYQSQFGMGPLGNLVLMQLPPVVFDIRRERVVEDAMAAMDANLGQLRRRLVVRFRGEQGEDEGGPRREFFTLLVDKLMGTPDYALFETHPRTRSRWFSTSIPGFLRTDPDHLLSYRRCGRLLGLSLVNRTPCDFRLPTCLFRIISEVGKSPFSNLNLNNAQSPPASGPSFPAKGRSGTAHSSAFDLFLPKKEGVGGSIISFFGLEDVAQVDKGVAASLREVEKCEDGDGIEAMCLSFPRHEDTATGADETVPSPYGGQDEVVLGNKSEFVRAMAHWTCYGSVAPAAVAFAEGFWEVVGKDSPVSLLSAHELEVFTVGTPRLDMKALRDASVGSGKVFDWLWSIVLDDFDTEQQKRFLRFVTGTDRAPVGGLGQVRITVQMSAEDTDRLPTAHTCFYYLLLPRYESREALKAKLLKALEHSEGFGII